MVTIILKGIQFHANHGVTHEEQAVGTTYVVDAEFRVETSATQSDSVHDTVDYGSVAATILSAATSAQYRTLERLAQVIVDRLLADFAPIEALAIEVYKSPPPLEDVRQAGVRLLGSRGTRVE